MINLEEKIKNNEDLIRKYTLDQWIALLKHICISCIKIPSKKEIESIMNANSFKVEYAEGRIIKIELYTNDLCWEDFKMELNVLNIVISRQKKHNAFEQITFIPLGVFRILNEGIFKCK